MPLTFDHAVIVVPDLAAATANYSALGFTVVPGGEHADGLTHNALIAFADGAYIELIAFKDRAPENHPFARAVQWGGGFVTYALLPANIERAISEAQARGLHIEGPFPGGRNRPDGVRIEWQTGRTAALDLPFLCADVTPRERRLPDGLARRHANGAIGISDITMLVSDLSASTARYRALLGSEPIAQTNNQQNAFQLGNTTVTLVQPSDEPMRNYLTERGDTPYSLSLRANDGAPIGSLNSTLTSGVNLKLET